MSDQVDAAVEPTASEVLTATDAWLLAHGLTYFVPERRADVRDALRWRRWAPLLLLAVLVGAGLGVLLAWLGHDDSGLVGDAIGDAPAVVVLVVGAAALVYALTALRAAPIVGWGLSRTLGTLRTLLSTTTRALPLLLLAITFLFINTEMWQVGSNLSVGSLWLVVVLFAVLAVGFLLVRLPEEVDRVDDDVDDTLLLRACGGTPLEQTCERLLADPDADPAALAEVRGFDRWNLVLVLLVVQLVQVLLLAGAVFAFLVVFGSLIMTEPVLTSWQTDPTFDTGRGLVQVSIFLAAFSGLYLTVSTVTDESYRQQFFAQVTAELERAVGVRAVYLALRRQQGDPAAEFDQGM